MNTTLNGSADGQIVISVVLDETKLQKALDNLGNLKPKTPDFSKWFSDIGAQLSSYGGQIEALFSPIWDISKYATKKAMDWETAFTGVTKTVDATAAEYDLLRTGIRQMALEIPIAASELAKITEIAGQLGIRGTKSLLKFTETAAKIEVSTNMSREEFATEAARIMNVMDEDFENVDRLGSAVVHLGNNFATTEEEIVYFANRISGAGAVVGMTTDNILGLATAMTSLGVTPEAGATAVQKVLFSLNNAARGGTDKIINNTEKINENNEALADYEKQLAIVTQRTKEYTDKTKESTKMRDQQEIEKVTKNIARLNAENEVLVATNGQVAVSQSDMARALKMTNKQLQEEWEQDPAGVFLKLVQALNAEGKDAKEMLDALGLSDQRLLRSMLMLAQRPDLLKAAFEMSKTGWDENVALEKESEKYFNTTEQKAKAAKNAIDDMAISVGTDLKNAFDDVLAAMSPWLKKMADWIEKNPEIVTALLSMGSAAFAAGAAMGALGLVLSGIGLLLSSPLGILVLLAAALGALWVAWENDFFNIREWTEVVISTVIDRFNQLVRVVQAASNTISKALKLVFTNPFDAKAVDKAAIEYINAIDEYIAAIADLGTESQRTRDAKWNLQNQQNKGAGSTFLTDLQKQAFQVDADMSQVEELLKAHYKVINDDAAIFTDEYAEHFRTTGEDIKEMDKEKFDQMIKDELIYITEYQENQATLQEEKQKSDLAMQEEEKVHQDTIKSYAITGMEDYKEEITKGAGESATAFKTEGTDKIEQEAKNLEAKMPGWGWNIVNAWVHGMISAMGAENVFNALNSAASKLMAIFKGESPPKVGALKHIDVWGENVGAAWAEGFAKGLTGEMKDVESLLEEEKRVLAATTQASTAYGSGFSTSSNSYAYNNTYNFNVPTATPYQIERATRRALQIRS